MISSNKAMARRLSTAQAKSRLTDRVALAGRQGVRAKAGLAGLAGGWKGSDDLVKALGKVRRARPRRPVPLG